MKRLLKILAGVLLCAAMLCALIFPASGTSTIYLMAVNDKVHETTVDNMPMMVDGTLYVPYTMLSSQVSGINLGVRAQYSATRNTLTVTGGGVAVTFDTRNNTAMDTIKGPLSVRAVVRNSMAYLPIAWLCDYFSNLNYSLIRTPYCTLVRLTNGSVILDDAEFLDAADNLLRDNLARYQSSLVTPTPTVSPSAAPTPTAAPSPSLPPTPQQPNPLVYLAFRWGEYAGNVAAALEQQGQRGLFLFSADELAGQEDLVRRLAGQGHQIGLALTGTELSGCLEQWEQGRRWLAQIARCTTVIASADELNKEGRQALEEAGCVLWTATQDAAGLTASALLRRLNPTRANYVEFPCDQDGLALLNSVLRTLTGDEYRLRQALAPAL